MNYSMKITVYTITDCQFSKQEKEYLTANKLQYEEKNLETNKEFLTEMLAVSNNFAGTPVTKIEKDDGQIVVLKGFTKEEYDVALGLTPPPAKTEEKPKEQTAPPADQTQPVADAQNKPPAADTTTQANPAAKAVLDQPAPTMPPPTPVNPTVVPPVITDDPLNAVLEDLQAKVNETQPSGSVPPAPTPTQPVTTPATDDSAATLPKIPDFQGNQ